MSGTVLSTRTDRHTPNSSGAARAAASIRRQANVAPAASQTAPPAAPAATQAPTPAPAATRGAAVPEAAADARPEPGPALTLTLAIPLTGEALSPQAYRLLDALRELVELSQGTITTTPPDAAQRRDPATPRWADGPAVAPSPPANPHGRGAGLVDPVEVRLLTASRQVLVGGQPLAMTRLEFDLLMFLAGNPRRVFTRAQLLSAVWGYEHTGERTVDVHVRRLRVKMGVHVPLITTVYGVGYRLDDDARIVVDTHE